MTATAKLERPVMRFFGEKWRDAPWILSHFPPHRVYVEPFGGGASVLMRKPRAWLDVYNDISDETYNVFRVLRDREMGNELKRVCELTLHSKVEMDLTFEPVRDDEGDLTPAEMVEQARRTIARTFLCMASNASEGGKHGHSPTLRLSPLRNVGMEWQNYPTHIGGFIERLRGVTVHHMDAFKLIPKMDKPRTLFYVDPPYVRSTRSLHSETDKRKHYTHEFTDKDHIRLAEALHEVEGMVVLSGYRSEMYDELYAGWQCSTKTTYVGRARKGIRKEVVWMNDATVRNHAQLSMFS